MKTDDLISMLANSAVAVEPNAAQNRFAMALGWGAFGSTLLMAISLLAALRLSLPGVRLGHALHLMVFPVMMIWLLSILTLLSAEPATREQLIYGVSWTVCPFYITTLSVPVFIAALWAMKGLAPTQPVQAGAAAGLVAGSAGAMVYALFCTEMAAPFLSVWYVTGMLIPTAVGALLGPLLLRW
jgi:hypothetical protein